MNHEMGKGTLRMPSGATPRSILIHQYQLENCASVVTGCATAWLELVSANNSGILPCADHSYCALPLTSFSLHLLFHSYIQTRAKPRVSSHFHLVPILTIIFLHSSLCDHDALLPILYYGTI